MVVDAEGDAQRGVVVRRIVGGATAGERVTDAHGGVAIPASDTVEVRYAATRGADVAWADVAHVRARPCDPRVELFTGRPAFGSGETAHVLGYVRGCDQGRDAPIVGERVVLRTGDVASATAVTGADGAFTADVSAHEELIASVRGVDHRRTLRIEAPPSRHRVDLRFDRAWAAPGETVTATVGDADGAWPRHANLRYAVGAVRGVTPIGPGHPGVFSFAMPPTREPLARVSVRVEIHEITDDYTFAYNDLWTGTRPEFFERPPAWSPTLPVSPAMRGPTRDAFAPGDGLDVTLDRALVVPGETLGVGLVGASSGATLVTLERGDVWASQLIPAGAARATLSVPAGARGLATVVATNVHAGEVRFESAAVEVAASRRFALRVATDRRTYAGGSTARVTISARNDDGRPRRATVVLWVADATWWEIAPDEHPPPVPGLRLAERPASTGDSAHPRGDGEEEGRRLDVALTWNGLALPGASFLHVWGHAGPLLRFDARGTFTAVAERIATAAGLSGATVCPRAARAQGTVDLHVRNVPWDLAAVRIAGATGTVAEVVEGVLTFRCPDDGEGTIGMGSIGTMGHGSGSGSGQGFGAAAHARWWRSVGGAVAFVSGRQVDASGDATIEVTLPAHPGRWRFEAVALADDGASATAHEVATTR